MDLYRLVERRRVLVEEPVLAGALLGPGLGAPPQLPVGSYLAEIEDLATGLRLRHPLLVEREGQQPQLPAGHPCAAGLVLPLPADVSPGAVVITAGWTWSGVDAQASGEPLPLRRLWVDAFAMQVHPVRHRD